MRETCEQRRQESQDNYRVVLIGLVVRSSSGPWISYRFPPASRQYYHTDSHQPSTSLPKSSPSKRFRQQEGLLSDHDRFESSMGVTYSQLHTETDRTCLLVGTWVSAFTWGIMACQLLNYLQTWKRDPLVLRFGVLFLFAVETTTTVMTSVGVYYQLLKVAPNTLEWFTIPLVYTASGYLDAVTLVGVDCFFISRYYRLSGNKWIATSLFAITLAATACFFRSTALGIRAAGEAISAPLEVANIVKRLSMSLRVAYAMEICAVTSTMVALLTELIGRLKQELLTANELIKRLILFNVGSGAFTAALSVATFVYSLRHVSSNTLVFGSSLSRSYLMAMLFNLAVRNFQSMARQEVPLVHITTSIGEDSIVHAGESVQKHSAHTLDEGYELS